MYDTLGYSEDISNQVKMTVNSSPLTEGKYDYSKERKGVYVIFIYNTKILLPLTFDEQQTRKDMLQLGIEHMTRTGLHDQCSNR